MAIAPLSRAAAPRPEHESILGRRATLYAVLLAALGLRLWHLGMRSVWTDEGSTWTAASAPLRELVRLCAEKDASPPLFYLLTSLAMKLGDGEAQLRLVSVLASVVLVWLTYRLGRLFAPREEATLAGILTALSPYQLMYAQEARSYTLVACLAVASFYFYLRAVYFGRRRDWLPYVAVTTLALYTQAIAVLLLGVQAVLAILTRDGRRHLLPWGLAVAVSLALYVPWVVISFGQLTRLGESHWYVRPPGAHEWFQVPRGIFLSPVPLVTVAPGGTVPGLDRFLPRPLAHLLLALVPLVPLLAATPSAAEPSRRGLFVRIALAALLLPLIAVLAAVPWKPLWLSRYFVFLTPFYAVLLARGLSALRPPALTRAWTALAIVANAYACVRFDLDYTKEPWRDAVHLIDRLAVHGKSAVLVTFDIDPFRFYNVKLEQPLAAFELSHPQVPFASDYSEQQLAELTNAAARRSAGYDEVWVVVRSPNSEIRREVARRGESVAAMGRHVAGRWWLNATNGPLRIVRYVRGV